MPEFTRPLPNIPPNLTLPEIAEQFPNIVRELGNWVAQQIQASEKRILADPRMFDQRIARALYASENEISLDLNRRAAKGAVLTILNTNEGYKAAFILGDGSAPDATVPTTTPHNLLSPTHTDTNTQSPSKGSIVAATSTKWDELVVGTDGFVLTADSAQTLGMKWAAAAAATATRRAWLPHDFWTQSNGTTMTFGFSGTYPNRYKSWLFVDAPASGPQAIHTAWRVPKEYVSGGTVKVFYTAEGASDGTYHPQIQYIPIAEVASNAITGQESMRGARTLIEVTTGDLLLATTGGVVQAIYRQATIDVGTMTGLAVDDLVLIDLARDSTQDTYPDTIRVVGVAVDYTATI